MSAKSRRTNIYLSPDVHTTAKLKADKLGISFSEYVTKLINEDMTPDINGLIQDIKAKLSAGEQSFTECYWSFQKHNISREKAMALAEQYCTRDGDTITGIK